MIINYGLRLNQNILYSYCTLDEETKFKTIVNNLNDGILEIKSVADAGRWNPVDETRTNTDDTGDTPFEPISAASLTLRDNNVNITSTVLIPRCFIYEKKNTKIFRVRRIKNVRT